MSSKKSSSKKKSRVFLDSPWSMKWSNISADDEAAILEEIELILSKHPHLKRNKKCDGKKGSSQETESEEKEHEEWIKYRKQLEIGINSVTRGLEKDCIVVVLLQRSPDPPLLTKHILPLCATRNVPVVSLREMNKVAKLMNISCLTALGLKRGAEQEISIFHSLWKSVKDKSTELFCPMKLFQGSEKGESPEKENSTVFYKTKMKYVMPSGKDKLKKSKK